MSDCSRLSININHDTCEQLERLLITYGNATEAVRAAISLLDTAIVESIGGGSIYIKNMTGETNEVQLL